MSERPAPAAKLDSLLAPLLEKVASLRPQERQDADAVAQLEREMEAAFPYAGDQVRAIGELIEEGVRDGWLCNRGDADSRFSRVAKATEATHGLSVDCVSMIGRAIDHTHPKGEVTIGFAAQGEDPSAVRFEGRPAGWVFLGPGTRHRPHVEGGRMNLIYFLPDGAVEWHT